MPDPWGCKLLSNFRVSVKAAADWLTDGGMKQRCWWSCEQPASHLSVRALLWLSRAAWRSFSRRFFCDSSRSASLGSSRWRGLMYCSSFSSSSFSLMRIRRSLSGSSSPGHASLSSLAICTSMVAILRSKRRRKNMKERKNRIGRMKRWQMRLTRKYKQINKRRKTAGWERQVEEGRKTRKDKNADQRFIADNLLVSSQKRNQSHLLFASSYLRLSRTFSASLLELLMNWNKHTQPFFRQASGPTLQASSWTHLSRNVCLRASVWVEARGWDVGAGERWAAAPQLLLRGRVQLEAILQHSQFLSERGEMVWGGAVAWRLCQVYKAGATWS